MTRTTAIVQARMTSTRLPGKVLTPICGQPVLAHVAARVGRAGAVDEIVVATTVNATDDPVAALAGELGLAVFRGSESDVLSRYLGAARMVDAESILRITADCPLIDPDVIDKVADAFAATGADYAANTLTRGYPIGMDAEIFTRDSLETAAREARKADEREHVTPFLYRHPERFSLHGVTAPKPHRFPELRLTLDTPEDLELIAGIYEGLFPNAPEFGLDDVLSFLARHQDLAALNQNVPHNWLDTRP